MELTPARIDSTLAFHPYHCRAYVMICQDWDTRQTEISANIGTAPDSSTIIVYPYRRFTCGYISKADARKAAATFKRELKQYLKDNGIKLSEPIDMTERFY